MSRRRIIVIDHSELIRKGIRTIMRSHLHNYELTEAETLSDITHKLKSLCPAVLLINPIAYLHNNGEMLKQIRQETINLELKIVAIVYAYYDEHILSLFDEVININDKAETIVKKIKKTGESEVNPAAQDTPPSQRELDVIRLIALGYSNKEIAEELHISIHTVISHRKNVSLKLGIKTAAGMTIYAVINKLISPSDFNQKDTF